MKKVFYYLLFVITSVATLTSCTEDEVNPTSNTYNGGGAGSIDPYKGGE